MDIFWSEIVAQAATVPRLGSAQTWDFQRFKGFFLREFGESPSLETLELKFAFTILFFFEQILRENPSLVPVQLILTPFFRLCNGSANPRPATHTRWPTTTIQYAFGHFGGTPMSLTNLWLKVGQNRTARLHQKWGSRREDDGRCINHERLPIWYEVWEPSLSYCWSPAAIAGCFRGPLWPSWKEPEGLHQQKAWGEVQPAKLGKNKLWTWWKRRCLRREHIFCASALIGPDAMVQPQAGSIKAQQNLFSIFGRGKIRHLWKLWTDLQPGFGGLFWEKKRDQGRDRWGAYFILKNGLRGSSWFQFLFQFSMNLCKH